jgi:hypothetical protein
VLNIKQLATTAKKGKKNFPIPFIRQENNFDNAVSLSVSNRKVFFEN